MYYRCCWTPHRITTRVDFKKVFLYARRGLLSTDITSAAAYVPNVSASRSLTKSGNCADRIIDRSNPWNRYLAAGASGISRTVVDGQKITLSWTDGHQSEFSFKWLRDHCADAFNPRTKQREIYLNTGNHCCALSVHPFMRPLMLAREAQLDTCGVPNNALVKNASVTAELPQNAVDPGPTEVRQHQVLRLRWSSDPAGPEQESTIRLDWLRQHCTSSTARDLRKRFGAATDGVTCQPDRVLWGEDVFAARNNPPCLEHDDIMDGDQPQPTSGIACLVGFLRTHGIALVRGVPTDMAGTEALARKIGHPRSTLYGPDMWATSADADAGEEAFQDSAYSKESLRSHTDCTYLADPPGLQVFNCVCPASKGGASTYVDGFAVGERLLQEHPEAFEFFSRVPLSYHCFDEGCHYMAEGPVFRLGALGEIVEMRYNDYDRAPLDYLSNDDVDRFYEYHQYLSGIIRDKAMVARVVLQPGDTVILNNHRTMHGRESFEGKRRLIGCYIGMDELASTARVCRL